MDLKRGPIWLDNLVQLGCSSPLVDKIGMIFAGMVDFVPIKWLDTDLTDKTSPVVLTQG
jgi:hypothetical protein